MISGPFSFGRCELWPPVSASFLVAEQDDRVAGYFSLTAGRVDTLESPERIRKAVGKCPVAVVILARLAVHLTDQGRGIGFVVSQDAIGRTLLIAEEAGTRAMLTDRVDEDAARFYAGFGFIASPHHEQEPFLMLKDAIIEGISRRTESGSPAAPPSRSADGSDGTTGVSRSAAAARSGSPGGWPVPAA